jgi:hypothetical protein
VEPKEVSLSQPTDSDVFFASLRLYDRPESELKQRPLDADADIDGFVEAAFPRNATIPPM